MFSGVFLFVLFCFSKISHFIFAIVESVVNMLLQKQNYKMCEDICEYSVRKWMQKNPEISLLCPRFHSQCILLLIGLNTLAARHFGRFVYFVTNNGIKIACTHVDQSDTRLPRAHVRLRCAQTARETTSLTTKMPCYLPRSRRPFFLITSFIRENVYETFGGLKMSS